MDMAISSDPSGGLPLSVLVMVEMLSSQYSVVTSTFVHSSVTRITKDLTRFLTKKNLSQPRRNHQLSVTFVWKQSKCCYCCVYIYDDKHNSQYW